MTDSTNAGPLAAVLAELGWKPEVLARRLNNFAALHGRGERMHVKTPYKWLHGTAPRSPWSVLALALLTDELGRVVTAAELGWSGVEIEAVSALSGLVLPWTAAGSLHAVRVVTDAGSMDRRILLTLLGAAVCVPAHEWLIARPEAEAALARRSGAPVTSPPTGDAPLSASSPSRPPDSSPRASGAAALAGAMASAGMGCQSRAVGSWGRRGQARRASGAA